MQAAGCILLSRRAGFFFPGKKGNVCAPLPLPSVGEEAPRRGVRRGRFRPSRAPGAPGISRSHRTRNVLQKQLDRLFSLAEGAPRKIEKTFSRVVPMYQKPGKALWLVLKCVASPGRNTCSRALQMLPCVKGAFGTGESEYFYPSQRNACTKVQPFLFAPAKESDPPG